MLIGWSPHQASANLHQPSAYLLDSKVLKAVGKTRVWEVREPAPELLLGQPSIVQSAISALRFEKKYRVATLSFAASDIDVAAFNAGERAARDPVAAAIDLFLEMAFAGVPEPNRPPVFAGTHTHTGRLEINIAMPRFVWTPAGELRSYNPYPPMKGSQNAWDALGDFLTKTFDWENPRSPDNARAVAGPDWLEKRVAAALRDNVKFTTATPKLFMLQGAKRIAASRQGRDRAGFLPLMTKVAAAVKYRPEPRPGGALALVSETDPHPLVLHGTCLGTGTAAERALLRPYPKRTLSEYWHHRAAWNTSRYAKDAWALTEPNWQDRVQTPQLALPSCHPDKPKPMQAPQRFATLARRFAAELRRLREHLVRTTALSLVGTCIAAFDRRALRRITTRLETLSYDENISPHGPLGGLDERPLHSSSAGSGPARRAGGGRGGHGFGLGDERHSPRDGAAQPRPRNGSSGAQSEHLCDRAGAEGDLPGYRLDQDATLSGCLRAIDVIRALRGAARSVFAQRNIAIGMDHERSFNVGGSTWEIVFARSGEITGRGDLSQEDYETFLQAICEQLHVSPGALQPLDESHTAFAPSL